MDYLGIDYGRARIGLAIGDKKMRLAVPLATVSCLAEVLKIIKEENIKVVVVGNPKTLAGKNGQMSSQVKEFARQLRRQAKVKVVMWDERLTTSASQSLAVASPKRQKRPVKKPAKKLDKDAVAAMLILQNYFDQLI